MTRHGTDVVSLGFGLAFLAVLAGWLLTRVADVELPPLGWLIAGAFVLFGVLGVVATIRGAHRADGAAAG